MFVTKKKYDELLFRVEMLEARQGPKDARYKTVYMGGRAVKYFDAVITPSRTISISEALDAICEKIGIRFEYEEKPPTPEHKRFKVVSTKARRS